MKSIKFRRPLFLNGEFAFFKYWGKNIGRANFVTAGQNLAYDEKEDQMFTCLTDKNGKEIYEGDIVKAHDHPTGEEDIIAEVIFARGRFGFEDSMIILGDYGSAWCEVIGNICENPDLIPKKEDGHE